MLQGFLKTAMMNYLALLGWNDGTEQEIYSAEGLQQAFALERITKSPAVFDKVKLSWMNGQHLRALPSEEVCYKSPTYSLQALSSVGCRDSSLCNML